MEPVEQAGEAMLRRLIGRRGRPGMVDVAAIREAGGVATAGLGLGRSPLAQHLAARRSGDTGMAVSGGALVHPLRRTEGFTEAADVPPALLDGMPTARPARVGATAVPSGAANNTAPSQLVDASAGPVAPSALTAPSPASLSSPSSAAEAPLAGIAAPRLTAAPAPGGAAPGVSGVIPQVSASAGDHEDVADTDTPLALARRASTSASVSLAGRDAGPAAAASPFAAPAAAFEGEAAAPLVTLSRAVAAPGGATAAAPDRPVADLTEQVQRDLHRRLAIERERQGLARWRR